MDIHPAETQRRYNETVGLYDARYSEIQRKKYPILLEMLSPNRGEKILDWGCGTGLAFEPLKLTNVAYVGLDFSLGMLSVSRQRHGGAVVLADCARLPFRSETFDGMLGATVIQNIVRKDQALREIFRVLKHGGRAVLSFPQKTTILPSIPKDVGLVLSGKRPCHEDRAIALRRPIR